MGRWRSMIHEVVRLPATRSPAGRETWRRGGSALLALVMLSTALLVDPGRPDPTPAAAVPSVAAPPALAVAAPSAAPSGSTPSPSLRRRPGAVPTRGSGAFEYATGRGPVLGTRGPLRRFRVAVERGSGEEVTAFAAEVQATLGDPRSWTGGGGLRLQLVSGSDPAEFTVYLATRDTAGRMCLRGGIDIRVGGRPYTSCRAVGKVIINLDRWRFSARPYVAAAVPLAIYRQYVINHEVGHELGQRHQGCPKAGGPAPVMVQQTLTLRGCLPYAWPRRGNTLLTGPPL